MKVFADDNFKFDENGKKLSKQVENTVGKGEIARYKQFLLFPQCFQKACFPGASIGVIVWEWAMQHFKLGCFRRKPEVLLQLCRHCAKTLTFCNISAITEDIYLKLGIFVHHPKNSYYQGRQFEMHFFQNYALILT